MMICAIIPARGGSKGVPRKNVRLLAGKPLIVYTIEHVDQVQSVSRDILENEEVIWFEIYDDQERFDQV